MWLVGVGVGVLAVVVAYKFVRNRRERDNVELHVKDWKEGVVYLIQVS